MTEDISREDIEIATLKALSDINDSLRTMLEFQERLGEAIEMLAEKMGYEFTIKEDEARA